MEQPAVCFSSWLFFVCHFLMKGAVRLADDFGLKIGVEGEKEFKNALRDINQSFKVLASEMNLL